MKSERPFYILLFGVITNDGDFMATFIFPHGPRLNTEAYILCLERGTTVLEYSTSSNRTLQHATHAREPSHGCEKIPTTTSSKTSSRFTLDCNPLIIMWVEVEWETNKTPKLNKRQRYRRHLRF